MIEITGLARMKGSSETKMGKALVEEIIGIMFMSRTYAHMAHLKTGSYAKHKALNKFYDDIVDDADELAEAAQGLWGKLDVPFIQLQGDLSDPVSAIEGHLLRIKNLSKKCDQEYLGNILQEGEKLYRKTIYLMKELS